MDDELRRLERTHDLDHERYRTAAQRAGLNPWRDLASVIFERALQVDPFMAITTPCCGRLPVWAMHMEGLYARVVRHVRCVQRPSPDRPYCGRVFLTLYLGQRILDEINATDEVIVNRPPIRRPRYVEEMLIEFGLADDEDGLRMPAPRFRGPISEMIVRSIIGELPRQKPGSRLVCHL